MKRIAILLACVMLAGCTAMPTETIGTDTVKSSVSISSENVSSVQLESAEAKSKKEISSKELSSAQADFSKASESKPKETSSEQLTNEERRAKEIRDWYKETYNVEIDASVAGIRNDPCIVKANGNFDYVETMGSMEFHPKKWAHIEAPIETAEKDAASKTIRSYYKKITHGVKSLEPIYYLGEVEKYAVYFLPMANTNTSYHYVYTRMAGYQFYTTSMTLDRFIVQRRKYQELGADRYSCGIYLIKDGKCKLLEEIYMDREITDAGIGEIYGMLPKGLQTGKFEHYAEAYSMAAGYADDPFGDCTQIAYYDRDGKYHVVVA